MSSFVNQGMKLYTTVMKHVKYGSDTPVVGKTCFYELVDRSLQPNEEVSMSKYKGNVVLLVNVASQ